MVQVNRLINITGPPIKHSESKRNCSRLFHYINVFIWCIFKAYTTISAHVLSAATLVMLNCLEIMQTIIKKNKETHK